MTAGRLHPFGDDHGLPFGGRPMKFAVGTEGEQGYLPCFRRRSAPVALFGIPRLTGRIENTERYLVGRTVGVALDMQSVLGFLSRHAGPRYRAARSISATISSSEQNRMFWLGIERRKVFP